jgi:hypothetical protein
MDPVISYTKHPWAAVTGATAELATAATAHFVPAVADFYAHFPDHRALAIGAGVVLLDSGHRIVRKILPERDPDKAKANRAALRDAWEVLRQDDDKKP